MDETRFDTLARIFGTARSRRRALGGLIAGAFGLLSWPGVEDATAHDLSKTCKKKSGKAKKKCLKRAKKHAATHPTGLSCPSGQRPCRGACLSVLICCDDSDCAGGKTCQQGKCACPPARPHVCSGSTVCRQCCTRADCGSRSGNDGQVCQVGQCVCTSGNAERCPSGTLWSGTCGTCCDHTDCSGAEVCTIIHLGFEVHAHCACTTGATCNDVCVSASCAGLCNEPCPAGVEPGEFCCSGSDPLLCFPAQGGGGFCDVP